MHLKWLTLIVSLVCLAAPASSMTVVYDNTTTATGPAVQPSAGSPEVEFGDQITLGPGPRTVSEFEIAFTGTPSQDGDETVRIRFYANDGASGAPGTVLFDSGDRPLPLPPSSFPEPAVLSGLSVVVPDTFTWTVQIGGVSFSGADFIAFPFYDPPTVGSSDASFYWFNSGPGGWMQLSPFDTNNLYARVTAVPEPATSLLVVGGILGLAAWRRRPLHWPTRRPVLPMHPLRE